MLNITFLIEAIFDSLLQMVFKKVFASQKEQWVFFNEEFVKNLQRD